MLTILGTWNEKSKGLLGTIQDNIQDAQVGGQTKKASDEEFQARKEKVQAQVKSGETGTSSGGIMDSMFAGASNFTTGRPGKTKGRR